VREDIHTAFFGRFEEFKTFFHGHTYTGNPLACAAARASLRLLRERVMPALPEKSAAFAGVCERLGELPHVGDVRRVGMMAGLELVEDPATNGPYDYRRRMGHQVVLAARERGAIIRPLSDTIVLMPPLGMTVAELERLGGIVGEAIVAATEKL